MMQNVMALLNVSPKIDAPKYTKKLNKHLFEGTLEIEIKNAYSHVKDVVLKDPLGEKCALRLPNDVLATLKKRADASIYFGGSLSQLDLPHEAFNTMDTGALMLTLESENVVDLAQQVGPITINLDDLTKDTMDNNAWSQLKRVNKDGEVAALCLLIFWSAADAGDADPVLNQALRKMAQDLTFIGEQKGVGSKLRGAQFASIRVDDNKRAVMGMSSWRKSLFISEWADRCVRESRHENIKLKAERLFKCMEEDKIPGLEEYKADTLSRYLILGSSLTTAVQKCFMAWEAIFKRNSLMDNITWTRALIQACANEEEIIFLTKELMMQQLAGIRTTFGGRAPNVLLKSVLLRKYLYIHLENAFPKLKDVVVQYSGKAFYEKCFGIQEHGVVDPSKIMNGERPEENSDEEKQGGQFERDVDGDCEEGWCHFDLILI